MLQKLDNAPFLGLSVGYNDEEYFKGILPHDIIYFVCRGGGPNMGDEVFVRYHLDKKFTVYESNIYFSKPFDNISFSRSPYYARNVFPSNMSLELIYKE